MAAKNILFCMKPGIIVKVDFTDRDTFFVYPSDIRIVYNLDRDIVDVQITGDRGKSRIKIDDLNLQGHDITSYADFESYLPLVFPELGGGSGTTPNLQEVLTQGNQTTLNQIFNSGATETLELNAAGFITLFNIANNNALRLLENGDIMFINSVTGNQTRLLFTPPTGNKEIFFPDLDGTIPLNLQQLTDNEGGNSVTTGNLYTNFLKALKYFYEEANGGITIGSDTVAENRIRLILSGLSVERNQSFQDKNGVIALLSDFENTTQIVVEMTTNINIGKDVTKIESYVTGDLFFPAVAVEGKIFTIWNEDGTNSIPLDGNGNSIVDFSGSAVATILNKTINIFQVIGGEYVRIS